jgi:hypothetical protein
MTGRDAVPTGRDLAFGTADIARGSARDDLSLGTAPADPSEPSTSRPFLLYPLLLSVACAGAPDPAPDLGREPRVLHFSPAHPELVLRLTDRAEATLPLARVRIDPADPDWGAFTITDEALPRRLEPGVPAEIHLRVDTDHFATRDPLHRHRPGAATLTFTAGGRPVRVPLRFSPDPAPDPAFWPRLGVLAGLSLLAGLRRWPWAVALPALACLAVAPLGVGVCPDLLGDLATRADLLQCADGRGGSAVQLLAHPDALGLPLVALLLAGHVGGLAGSRVCALALFAALVAAGSLDPQAVIAAQTGMRWGLWLHPLGAAALAVGALVHVRGAPGLPRLAAVGLAALLVTLLLGGPDLPIPFMAGLPHAAALAAGIGTWLAKLGLTAWALRRLPAPAWLGRLVVPLAALQVLVTAGGHILRSAAAP